MKGLLRILLDLLLRFVRTLDLPLLAALLALMGIGLATQFSAGNESLRGVAMQGAFYCVGLGALWVASRLPAHLLKQATPAIFVASLVHVPVGPSSMHLVLNGLLGLLLGWAAFPAILVGLLLQAVL